MVNRHAVRDSLTILAILLIGVLTAALVGPYVVDWGSHRALIERRLSAAAGTPVTVAGPIDLKLLPKPLFRLGGVAVGNGAGGRPRLSARSLDVELSLAALMRGQVQFVDATLDGPSLHLVQARDGGFDLGLPSGPTADRVAFDHLGVRGGALDLALLDGRHLEVRGIDLDGEAASLRGPFKASGSVGSVPFRLATGTPDGGRLRVKLHLDGAGDRPSLDLDGTAAARPGAVGPGFDGTAAASGQVALDGTPAAVPWRATARLSADRDGAKASDVEVRAGADLRALIAAGDGSAAYAAGPAPPRAALTLRGAALDVDDLAVAPPNSDIAPPSGVEVLRLLLRTAGEARGAAPLRLDVDAAFDTATLAGRTALGTAATVRLGPEPGAGLVLSVEGPGGARLALDGRVEPGPPPSVAGPFGAAPATPSAAFRGRADLRAADLRRTAAWLRPAAPDLVDRVAAALPGRGLRAVGAVTVSEEGIAARDLDLHLDGTALAGILSLARAAGTGNPRLSADLSADALDLDRVPDLATVGAASRGLDLDLSLSARAVRLASSALGAVAAGRVALHVTRSGDDARLEKLALDIAGARLDASGSRDAAGGRGSVHIEAAAAGPLAEALAPILPPAAAAGLRARAALLSPLDATATLDAAADRDGALVPTRLAVAGRAGDVTLDGALTPDGSAADRPVALSLHLAAPRGADLLRLVGLSPPGAVAGAARVAASAQGTLAAGLTGRVEATLGDASASFAGRAATAGGEGRLTLWTPDLRPVLASAGLPAPAGDLAADAAGDLAWDGDALRWHGLTAKVGGSTAAGDLSLDLAQGRTPGGEPLPVLHGRLAIDRLPAEALLGLALGPGAAPPAGAVWSSAPFAAAPAALPRGELALTVGDMPLRGAVDGRSVSLTLRTAPDSVALADVAGAVADGSVAGSLSLRRDGPGATLSGRLAWRDVTVEGGGLAARTSGSEEVAAAGNSPAALVGALAGTGAVTLSGALSRTDPTAPARVLAAVTARDAAAERGSSAPEPTPPDGEALRRDLDAALDAGPLPVEAAKAPAVLAGGVLSLGPLRRTGTVALPRPGQGGAAAADWSAETSLSLDLRTLTLASRVDLGAAPGGGAASVTRAGPLGEPAPRSVEAGGLVEAVQAAAVARAQDRIDVLEQDIRERAAFNRQLKVIDQRRQMEREQAEAARQAELARAAAEAQARAAAARAAAQAAEQQRADAARQKAEDARVQAQVEAAARAGAARERAEREEAERLRSVDRARRSDDPPLDLGDGRASPDGPRSPLGRVPRAKGRDPFDLPPPPSIIQERDR
ncbi:AsmA family protein [Lichenibacterium dinghuense]|uniref:AsmA family protein n=1 Tax=Lichenibacterium dinghuense TaxID=2895977 RepID=UPI001F2F62E7|nr:AsmA family protein [Lichenibacterium sp. 6Y81]